MRIRSKVVASFIIYTYETKCHVLLHVIYFLCQTIIIIISKFIVS